MLRSIFVSFVCIAFVITTQAQCSWIDGQDPSLSSDAGRGVSSWEAHLTYAQTASDLTDSYTFVGNRLATLKTCLYLERYARLYADLSICIAGYGIKLANWKNNGSNPVPMDGGCGILDWNAHFDYINKNGVGVVDQLVKNRLNILSKKIIKAEYAKLYADVSVLIAKSGLGTKSKCNWIDGQDPSLQSDPGRGVSSWKAHSDYVNATTNLTDSYSFVGNRMTQLKSCLEKDNYADLYAELSVKIASYGIKLAGWQNNLNNSIPNDGGCGYLVWKAHFDYVQTNGIEKVPGLISNRLAILSKKISKTEYAKLYADASVMIAKYGNGK